MLLFSENRHVPIGATLESILEVGLTWKTRLEVSQDPPREERIYAYVENVHLPSPPSVDQIGKTDVEWAVETIVKTVFQPHEVLSDIFTDENTVGMRNNGL